MNNVLSVQNDPASSQTFYKGSKWRIVWITTNPVLNSTKMRIKKASRHAVMICRWPRGSPQRKCSLCRGRDFGRVVTGKAASACSIV